MNKLLLLLLIVYCNSSFATGAVSSGTNPHRTYVERVECSSFLSAPDALTNFRAYSDGVVMFADVTNFGMAINLKKLPVLENHNTKKVIIQDEQTAGELLKLVVFLNRETEPGWFAGSLFIKNRPTFDVNCKF
jgi:hypothetical protein